MLTGVGRFHEMTYIIQLLLECDQFEALVHHGVENVRKNERYAVSIPPSLYFLRSSSYGWP